MFKQVIWAVFITGLHSTAVIASAAPRWEYQGTASTGEKVYLNLASIQPDTRKGGYFFSYRIGKDSPSAYTPCDGKFQVANADGVTFKPLMLPRSETTQKMLARVCNYQRQQSAKPAYVIAPPSNIRTSPNGDILCSVKSKRSIQTYGAQGDWFYTDVCGPMGVIHSSQIKF